MISRRDDGETQTPHDNDHDDDGRQPATTTNSTRVSTPRVQSVTTGEQTALGGYRWARRRDDARRRRADDDISGASGPRALLPSAGGGGYVYGDYNTTAAVARRTILYSFIIAPRYFFLFIFFLLSSPLLAPLGHTIALSSLSYFPFPIFHHHPPVIRLFIFSLHFFLLPPPAAPVLQPPAPTDVFYFMYTSFSRRSVSSYIYFICVARESYDIICFYVCIYLYYQSPDCSGQSACATRGRLSRTPHGGGGARRVVSASLRRADRFSLFFFFPRYSRQYTAADRERPSHSPDAAKYITILMVLLKFFLLFT